MNVKIQHSFKLLSSLLPYPINLKKLNTINTFPDMQLGFYR